MRILDLFCGAGGAAMGLHRAMPEAEITGIDIAPQPNYPFRFIQADAVTFDLSGYDLIWASPPCQSYAGSIRGIPRHERPRLIEPIREALVLSGTPYIIENVAGARPWMRSPVLLCGTMFDLRVFRHRLFECSFPVTPPAHPRHAGRIGFGPDDYCTVAGHGGNGAASLRVWSAAMGIDWMTKKELSEAIPPAYSEYLGLTFSKGEITGVA